MSYKTELQKCIDKKQQEIAVMQQSIVAAQAHIEGLKQAMKLAPPEGNEPAVKLRSGSDLDKVRNILLGAGTPQHLDAIMEKMGRSGHESKTSLAGSLNTYASKNRVFTKNGPNIFGLIEFNSPDTSNIVGIAS